MPKITYVHALRSYNDVDKNSALAVHYEVGRYDDTQVAILDLFSQITYSSCFSQLRTKEQLGYIVHSTSSSQNGTMSFRIIVQSDTKDPIHLDSRVESWIGSLKKELSDLKEEDFISFRTGLVAKILEKDKSLKEEYNRWYNEVQYPRPYSFNRAEITANEVEKLQRSDIINFYNTYIAEDGPERRKFLTQVFAKDHPLLEPFSTDQVINIGDPAEWKSTCKSFYKGFNEIME